MKIFSLTALFAIITTAAIAAPQGMPGGNPGGRGIPGGMDMMANLTDAQRACIEQQNCPQVQMPNMGEKPEMGNMPAAGEKKQMPQMGERPQMPEMTDELRAEMQAAQECQRKAFETCGIEMPAMPERAEKTTTATTRSVVSRR